MVKLVYTEEKKYVTDSEKFIGLDKYIRNLNIDKIAFDYLKNLESENVCEDNIEDLYIYDGIPLYYFERPTIYLQLKNIIFYILIIQNVINEFGSGIAVETDDELFFNIGCGIFNLNCKRIIEKKIKKEVKVRLKSVLKLLIRGIRGLKSYAAFKFQKNKCNFLVVSHSADINLIKVDGKAFFFDTQLGCVMQEIKKKYNLFNLQFMANLSIIKKTLNYKEKYIPFEFFTVAKKLKSKKLIEDENIVNKLNLIHNFDFNFDGLDVKNIVIKNVFDCIEERYIEDIEEILMAQKFIRKFKIKKCLVMNEGDRGRCFIAAGNKENIDTYAIQHGIINDISTGYTIHSKYKGIIVPKTTFVWGEKYKNILINNSDVYNSENIKVVGQVRTDLFVNNKYSTNDEKQDKIKILYATQNILDLLKPATIMLFKALCGMKNRYELIIKLHPGDTCFDFYRDMARKYKIKNMKLIKEGDIYELISWCDIVISVHSTVVLEGALMHKPSICIILPKYNDAGGFIKDGISIGTKNEKEISDVLNNLNNVNNDYEDKLKNYLEYNFYKVDGNVTSRIMDVIR